MLACGLAFDGAHAAAQRRRRLGLGEVLEVPQHQDGSLPGGKRSQAAQQEIPVCDRRGGVRGARIGSGGSASLITDLTGRPTYLLHDAASRKVGSSLSFAGYFPAAAGPAPWLSEAAHGRDNGSVSAD